ncbi:MAG: tetratricopeptide repeat protein [Bacteroidota bacterium]|nr:tetratricopeptide repeat protein [Bacteroidota bacterium]
MRKASVVLLLLVFNALLVYGQLNIDYCMRLGVDKIIKNDYRGAIEDFNTIIRFAPDNSDAYYFRAYSKLNLGDYRGTIDDCSTALKNRPEYSYNHSNYFLIRGNARERLMDLKGAREDYAEAVDMRPSNQDAHFDLGIINLKTKRYDEAIANFNAVLDLNDRNAYAYVFRGLGKQLKGLNNEANADYEIALRKDPKNIDAYLKRGRNRLEMKDYKGAIEDLDKTLKLDSTVTFAYFNRALAKSESLDYNGAMSDYNKVIQLDPSNDITYYNRAELKAKVRDFAGAIDDYTNVIRVNPNNVYTYFNRALMWQRLNNNRAAIKDYTEAINLNPQFAVAYYNRSIARRNVNDLIGSIKDYKMSVQLKASLGNLVKSGLIDSTGLAKVTEFKADFSEGNVKIDREGNSGIAPFANFALYYTPKDSVAKYLLSTERRMANMNKQWTLKGKFLLSTKDDSISSEKAGELLSKLENETSDANNFLKLFANAILKAKTQDFNGALDDYNKIIEQKPDYSMAYFNRGNLRYEMIRFLSTLSDMSNFTTIGSSQPDTQNKRKDYSEVVADYSHTISLDPGFYQAYFNLANVKIASRDFKNAIKYFSKAIDIEPKFSEAYYNRGLTYIYIHQTNEGCLDLSKAGELGVKKAYEAIKELCNK